MRLSRYFFRQFLPPFLFGLTLFLFVLVLDKLFDLLDLIFNKGIGLSLVGKLFILIIPTVLPLTIPMSCILACLVTFGRLSEENELTAVRAAGVSLVKALWLPPAFALFVSIAMIPVNTALSPKANREFFSVYEKLLQAEPLVNVTPKSFFSIKNIRIFADRISPNRKELNDVFVYQLSEKGDPPQRIFAKSGTVKVERETFRLNLRAGHLQKLSVENPRRFMNTSFASYDITIPLNIDSKSTATRFRNFTSGELKKMGAEFRQKGIPVAPIQAENSLRYALAFAPFCLTVIGIPLATALKKGSRSFSFGVAVIVIFAYYLLLILGLTFAEKGKLPSDLSLWIANLICLGIGMGLISKLLKR